MASCNHRELHSPIGSNVVAREPIEGGVYWLKYGWWQTYLIVSIVEEHVHQTIGVKQYPIEVMVYDLQGHHKGIIV